VYEKKQMDAAVSTHELSKRFGPTLALDRLDLTIHPGEAVGLLGHNEAVTSHRTPEPSDSPGS
jgi:ABC-type multidrug transport system ATPase subunit